MLLRQKAFFSSVALVHHNIDVEVINCFWERNVFGRSDVVFGILSNMSTCISIKVFVISVFVESYFCKVSMFCIKIKFCIKFLFNFLFWFLLAINAEIKNLFHYSFISLFIVYIVLHSISVREPKMWNEFLTNQEKSIDSYAFFLGKIKSLLLYTENERECF